MPLPSSVSVRACSLWFETVITTGPAPTLLGEIVTFCLVITPVSSSVTGGRGLLAKSSPPPQPARASANAKPATAVRRMRGRLTEPDGTSTCDELVDLALDLAPDPLGDRLHEREVICVFGSICIKRNGFEEPNLEFRRQIHCAGGGSGPRKCVVDREIDEPRQALQRPHVGENRHRLLGSDHRHGD